MAGACTAGGLGLDGDGNVILLGTSELAWPHESTCPIATHNGLHVDPGTGKAWVAPDLVISTQTQDQTFKTIDPTNGTTKNLADVDISYTAPACTRTYMSAIVGGGYQGYRLGNGNFWLVRRSATLYVDAAPIYTTGSQIVGACENNSGGTLSNGGPIDSVPFSVMLNPGQVVRIACHYQLELPAFSDALVNGFTFRSPWIVANFFSVI